MNPETQIGFEPHVIQVPSGDLLPLRQIKEPQKIARYKTMLVSVKEYGLIEPLMVYPPKDAPGQYLPLDGHLRWHVSKQLGQAEAD
jgi:ParB-like chromosome segregation protein Spo0J